MGKLISDGVRLLKNPEVEFKQLSSRSFESVVGAYLKLLVLTGLAAGAANLMYTFLRTGYMDLFMTADINYSRMLNYAIGQAMSVLFFYLFAGTFLFFFLSLLLRSFFRIKYLLLLKVMITALYPLLLFGWLPFMPLALLVWCVFLFAVGVRTEGKRKERVVLKRD